MQRINRIVYWIATLWLALGMLSTGVVQTLRLEGQDDFLDGLGYPSYFPLMLGVWKALGIVALLVPGYPVLKEWAYAGFFFAMSGAVYSHLAADHAVDRALPSLFLLILTVVSWYFRPSDRRVVSVTR
jgi:hypothetical protein